MIDLQDGVHDLHTKKEIVITTSRNEDGRIAWKYTVSGEDFLDGYWSETYRGVVPKGKPLLVAIHKELTRLRKARRKEKNR